MMAKAQENAQKLGGIGDLTLSSMLKPKAAVGGGWHELAIEAIDEDPHQPRGPDNPGFAPDSIKGLAATIADRGLKTPISVRNHPDVAGRYIINHGHRRFRAVQQIGQSTIRGYVDNDYNDDDQVIENLQRNDLTARELADYIGRKLAEGQKKGDIAKKLGVSAALVSQHCTLLDLPDAVARAFNEERVQDVTVVNELVRAFRKDSAKVEAWLADDGQEITRGTVKLLQEFIEDGGAGDGSANETIGPVKAKKDKKENAADPDKIKKAILRVRFKDRLARIVMDRRPPAEGFAWVKYDDDGEEVEASMPSIELLALVEA